MSAALAMLVEFEHGGGDEFFRSFGHGGDPLTLGDGLREDFFEALVEVGLVIEEVELRRCAGHEEEDDALGFLLGGRTDGSCSLGAEVAKDRGTEAHAGGVEELAAGLDIEHSEFKAER